MARAVGQVRHDITFTCPICDHTDTIDMPIMGPIDCDECGEELEIVRETNEKDEAPAPFWKDWIRKD